MKKFLAIFTILQLSVGVSCAMSLNKAVGRDRGELFRPVADGGQIRFGQVGFEQAEDHQDYPELSNGLRSKNKRKAQDQAPSAQHARSSKAAKQVHAKKEMPSLYADAFLNGDIPIRPEYRQIPPRPDRVRELRAGIDKAKQPESGIKARSHEQAQRAYELELERSKQVLEDGQMQLLLEKTRLLAKETADVLMHAQIYWSKENIEQQESALASWQDAVRVLEKDISERLIYSPGYLGEQIEEAQQMSKESKKSLDSMNEELQFYKKEMVKLIKEKQLLMRDTQRLLEAGQKQHYPQEWIDNQNMIVGGWIDAVQVLGKDIQDGVVYSGERLHQERDILAKAQDEHDRHLKICRSSEDV